VDGKKDPETVELMSRYKSMVDGYLRPPVHCYLASSVAPTYLEASSIHDRRPQLVVWNIETGESSEERRTKDEARKLPTINVTCPINPSKQPPHCHHSHH
jgi:hypothetical protein